jgi:hypothetical protein
MEVILFVSIASAICGAMIGMKRESPHVLICALLGAVFGPLGVIAALGIDLRPSCTACGEHLSKHASICPHCHTEFSDPVQYEEITAAPRAKREPVPDYLK